MIYASVIGIFENGNKAAGSLQGNFLTIEVSISSSRRAMLHEISHFCNS
jgi:hypothetical protein